MCAYESLIKSGFEKLVYKLVKDFGIEVEGSRQLAMFSALNAYIIDRNNQSELIKYI